MFESYVLHERLKSYRFILASSSPRRREILAKNLKIRDIVVCKSDFAEDLDKTEASPQEYVKRTAYAKGQAVLYKMVLGKVLGKLENTLVLASDTVIVCNGEIFEKPETKQRHYEMFQTYREQGQLQVMTAVVVFRYDALRNKTTESIELTTSTLQFLTEIPYQFIREYIESEEALDAAGGFKYQDTGCLLFDGLEGDYFNVVGLPASATFKQLHSVLEVPFNREAQ